MVEIAPQKISCCRSGSTKACQIPMAVARTTIGVLVNRRNSKATLETGKCFSPALKNSMPCSMSNRHVQVNKQNQLLISRPRKLLNRGSEPAFSPLISYHNSTLLILTTRFVLVESDCPHLPARIQAHRRLTRQHRPIIAHAAVEGAARSRPQQHLNYQRQWKRGQRGQGQDACASRPCLHRTPVVEMSPCEKPPTGTALSRDASTIHLSFRGENCGRGGGWRESAASVPPHSAPRASAGSAGGRPRRPLACAPAPAPAPESCSARDRREIPLLRRRACGRVVEFRAPPDNQKTRDASTGI